MTLNLFSKSEKGQLVLISLLIFSFVVGFLAYSALRMESVQRSQKINEVKLEHKKRTVQGLDLTLKNYFDQSINSAAEEIALYGGYRKEKVPPVSTQNIPFFFYDGRVLQIPTEDDLKQHMLEEVNFRFSQYLDELVHNDQYQQFLLEVKDSLVKIDLRPYEIYASLDIEMEYTIDDEKQRFTFSHHQTYDLRLLYLRNRAEKIVFMLYNHPLLKEHFMDIIGDDKRIPTPHKDTFDCENSSVYKIDLEPFVVEDVYLSTILTAKDIQFNDTIGDNQLYFDFQPYPHLTQLSLRDRFGNTNRIIKTGRKIQTMDESCVGGWDVWYNITIPLKISITDLRQGSKISFGLDDSLFSTLTFNFNIQTKIVDNKPIKREPITPVAAYCGGVCETNISAFEQQFDGSHIYPEIESLSIDNCEQTLPSSKRLNKHIFSNIPCGKVFLKVVPENKSLYTFQNFVSIPKGDIIDLSVNIKKDAALYGKINRIMSTYCTNCNSIKYGRSETLHYVFGIPPRYMDVFLNSLEQKDLNYESIVDTKGNYVFKNIRSGTYLISTVPSLDDDGNVGYKVMPQVSVIEIYPGTNQFDMTLVGLNPVKTNATWTTVEEIRGCRNC